MKQFIETIKDILDNGYSHADRTGTGRRSIFGKTLRFKMSDGFPIVTTRKIPYKSAFKEMIQFIKGSTDNAEFNKAGISFWNGFAPIEENIKQFIQEHVIKAIKEGKTVSAPDKDCDIEGLEQFLIKNCVNNIGPMYGYNWRHVPITQAFSYWPKVKEEHVAEDKLEQYKKDYNTEFSHKQDNPETPTWEEYLAYHFYSHVDQLQRLIVGLSEQPFGSRHVMSVWMPQHLPFDGYKPYENVLMGKGCLAPCHILVQCFVKEDETTGRKKLSLLMYQRSADFLIGSASNIAQYSLLLHMLAYVTDMDPDEFIYDMGDCHIYLNHLDDAPIQAARTPHKLPTIKLRPGVKSIYDFTIEDIEIVDYEHDEPIKYSLSI